MNLWELGTSITHGVLVQQYLLMARWSPFDWVLMKAIVPYTFFESWTDEIIYEDHMIE